LAEVGVLAVAVVEVEWVDLNKLDHLELVFVPTLTVNIKHLISRGFPVISQNVPSAAVP